MSSAMVYQACLEISPDGACLAQLRDLPVCFARGTGESETLQALEAALPDCFTWLSRHDQYMPRMQGLFRIPAAETVRISEASIGAFFQADAQPLSAEDLDWYTALLEWSYADLEEACRAPRAPGGSGSASPSSGQAPWAIVRSIIDTQYLLLSCIEPLGMRQSPPLPRLLPPDLVRHVASATLTTLRQADKGLFQWQGAHNGERWSLRKMLRRTILLVREQTQALG